MATRGGALTALETAISSAMGAASIVFLRDPEQRLTASHEGFCVMRDGNPGNPEYLMSPLRFCWEHEVDFEIAATGPDRAATLETIIALFEPAVAADRTLGGAVEDARIMNAPQISEDPVDDAEIERYATLTVQLVYTTDSGAG